MADHIPPELYTDIFTRGLTLEDLGRCMCVCKHWYSLITSPLFISLHTKQTLASTSKNGDLLLLRECTNEFQVDAPDRENYSIHHLHKDSTFHTHKRFDFPFKSYNSHFRIIGCVNRVICFSDDMISVKHVVILWNPTVRRSYTLPKPNVTFDLYGAFVHSFGFGFNADTNSFKVVRVVYLMGDVWLDGSLPMVEVYDLSVGSWKNVDPLGFDYVIDQHGSQVFLNGAVHWTGSNRNFIEDEFFNMIVSFDLRTDVFKVMKMPDCLVACPFPRSFIISMFEDSLAVIDHMFLSTNDCQKCCVWVMKQYGVAESWTKLFNINLTTRGLLKVCGVLKNEEALAIAKSYPGKELVSYDPKCRKMNFIGNVRGEKSVYVNYFEETLALLGVKEAKNQK